MSPLKLRNSLKVVYFLLSHLDYEEREKLLGVVILLERVVGRRGLSMGKGCWDMR